MSAPREPELQVLLSRTVQVVWRRKWPLLITVGVIFALTVLWTARQPRVYQAFTAIVVDQQSPEVLGKEVHDVVDISPYAYRETEDYLNTQLVVACSSAVFQKATQSLVLHERADFCPDADRANASDGHTVHSAAACLSTMVRCAVRRKKMSIIDISVQHTNPALAKAIADAVAQAYMDQNVEHRVQATAGAVQWLDRQLAKLKDDLEAAELELYQFRKQNDLVSMSLRERQNLTAEELTLLNHRWNTSRIDRMELGTQLQQLQSIAAKDPVDFPVMPRFHDTLVRELKAKVIEQRRKYAELKERYLAKHPLVGEQQVNVERAENALRRELNSMIAGVQTSHAEALKSEQALAKMLRGSKTEAFMRNKHEVAYRRLERKAATAENLYKIILARRAEAEVSAQLRVNNIRVLEPAVLPIYPIRPRVQLSLVLGLLFGLLLGASVVVLLELFDNTIKNTEDIDADDELVVLGLVPIIDEAGTHGPEDAVSSATIRNLVAHYRPLSKTAEFCRAIRTNLHFSSPDRPLRKIAVTSPGPEEGKTTLVANLAVTLAQRDAKVLVVDADLRRPKLHTLFDVPNSEGITTAIREARPLGRLIKQTAVPNLFILPSGPLPPNPAELCHSSRMEAVLDALADQFDWVILDTPPVMAVTDPVILSKCCDGTVLIARSERTTKPALRETRRRLLDIGAPLLGCVVNRVDLGKDYRYRYLYKKNRYAYTYGAADPDRVDS